MANFKEGNTVQLKDKFYDEPSFKKLDRFNRKYISSLAERRLKITHIFISCEEVITVYDGISNNSAHVPVAILELARPKPQITGVWFDECTDYPPTKPVDVCNTCVYKQAIERKQRQQEEWLDAHKKKPVEAAKPIEPKIGMWAVPVMDTNPLTDGKRGCSISPYVQGREFRIGRMYVGSRTGNVWLSAGYGDPGIELAACKLLPDYKPMRKWTEAEITEAKCIIAEIDVLAVMYGKRTTLGFYGTNTKAEYSGQQAVARCCPTDECNVYIGSMVALSKCAKKELPSWIRSTK